jgi:acetyltransferase-like isoleucine patch superfamily enzyme
MDKNRLDSLLHDLKSLTRSERLRVLDQWNRSLPLADYIVDRWEKATALGFKEGASIYDSSLVIGDVKVGRHTWVGPFTVLDGSGGLIIGDYCSISAGVQIYTHDTVRWATTRGVESVEYESVRIGSGCYIGPNAIISKGVSLGDDCIIGANSFVNTDVPSGTRAWGVPAKVICG